MADQNGNAIPDLMTADEVATFLRKSPLTIKRWVRERKIPFVPMGNENLFDRAEIARWIAEKRVPAEQDVPAA